MSKYCAWYCGGVLRQEVVRRVRLAGRDVTVLKRYCPKCGWQHEDYRVKRRQAVSK